jgi:hypothetical protein
VLRKSDRALLGTHHNTRAAPHQQTFSIVSNTLVDLSKLRSRDATPRQGVGQARRESVLATGHHRRKCLVLLSAWIDFAKGPPGLWSVKTLKPIDFGDVDFVAFHLPPGTSHLHPKTENRRRNPVSKRSQKGVAR